MIVTLTLNPSIDYILQVPSLGLEDTLRAEKASFQAGGKGINVSRVLKRLDLDTEAWGFAGGDTGRWLTGFLDTEQVPHRFVSTAGHTRVNAILTDTRTQQQLRVSAPGEPIVEGEKQALIQQLESLPNDVHWVALGGSLPPGVSPDCIRQFIEHLSSRDKCVILDADGQVLKQGLEGRPYLIKPNQYELSRLVGTDIKSRDEMIDAARRLIGQGLVSVVVISLAEAGALWVDADQVLHGQAPPVEVLSKVGAGDSMVAGLLKGLLEKASPELCLAMGIAAGTAAVMTAGSELCHAEQFRELLPRIQVESVAIEAGSL